MKINSNQYIHNNLNNKNIEQKKTKEEKPELDKMEQIKQSIENGKYKINIEELSNKIVDDLL